MKCNDIVYLNSASSLKFALLRAKEHIDFTTCSDVTLVKLEQIEKEKKFSIKREIMFACKELLTLKTTDNQIRWGIGITPLIKKMFIKQTCKLIDDFYNNADKVSQHYDNHNFIKIEFHRFVGHLVTVAIKQTPATKSEFRAIYAELWELKENKRNNGCLKNKLSRETELTHTKKATKVILPPGAKISKIIEFLYTKKVKERVFDPIIADMHVEYFEALDNNLKWKMRWIHLRGIINLFIAVISKFIFSYIKNILGIINVN